MGKSKANSGRYKLLNGKKEQYLARIERLYQLIPNLEGDPKTLECFMVRHRALAETKDALEEVIDELNALNLEISDNADLDFETMETALEKIGYIDQAFERVNVPAPVQRPSQSEPEKNKRIKLPAFTLPAFSGDVKQWPIFYEMFNRLVNGNKDLSDIEKVQYLIGQLSGKALAVISGIPPIESNYGIILQALVDRYEDKRQLAGSYLNQMLDFKSLTAESATGLDSFLEKFVASFEALKALGIEDLADCIVLHVALSKVDPETARSFEMAQRNSSLPSFKSFVQFVKEQAKIIGRAKGASGGSSSSSGPSKQREEPVPRPRNAKVALVVASDKGACVACGLASNHPLSTCKSFIELPPSDRYQLARDSYLCLNCLGGFHKVAFCRSQLSCRHCNRRHNTLLCFSEIDNSGENGKGNAASSGESKDKTGEKDKALTQTVSLCNQAAEPCQRETILLATAIINVMDHSGQFQSARFLLDSASQSNLLTSKCCERLGLKRSKEFSSILGLGNSAPKLRGKVTLNFAPRFKQEVEFTVDALVVDTITTVLPAARVSYEGLKRFLELDLADEHFGEPQEVDGILGAEIFPLLLGSNRIVAEEGKCVAMETSLGYVIMGKVPVMEKFAEPLRTLCTFCAPENLCVERLVQQFWELENLPPSPAALMSPDELECEKIYVDKHTRDEKGCFWVDLPFKEDPATSLGDSFAGALKRFKALERRLDRSNMRPQYNSAMKELVEAGYMVRVNDVDTDDGYYLPHHAVIKDSSSTPLRIVYDASAKTTSGKSLNDILYSGKGLQANNLSVLINFRLFEHAFSCDIRKMYLQIFVNPEHCKYQRILWRFDPSEPIVIYQLLRVVFGMKSSPFVALRTIDQLADDEVDKFPLACSYIRRDMFVDDMASSVPSVKECKQIVGELTSCFAAGGFELRKWSTNSQCISQLIPDEFKDNSALSFDSSAHCKILGLHWNPNRDTLFFECTPPEKVCTKRSMLSAMAKIYDPLGLIAPVVFMAKLLIKMVWLEEIDWDETPSSQLVEMWEKFSQELSSLSELEVGRHLGVSLETVNILVGFCDGAKTGFGANVYLRSEDMHGNRRVVLVCSKSKVAPMQCVTTNRLELCGALLLSQLLNVVHSTISQRVHIESVYACTDSKVALGWIHSAPYKLDVFVSNRVAKIQENSSVSGIQWAHVKGVENPADCLSRGLYPCQLKGHSSWWLGPQWLRDDVADWPISSEKIELDDDTTATVLVNMRKEIPELMWTALSAKFSSWMKFLNSVVYVLRFAKIIKKPMSKASELEFAERIVLIELQTQYFYDLRMSLENGLPSKIHSLQKLKPFLENGLIRVGGRLNHADVVYDQKHPVLLPKRDHIVNLLIRHYHSKYLHTGPQLLLSLLRQRYWIISGRAAVRSVVSKCNFCFKANPKGTFPLMADLPPCRVTESRPFAFVGLDYGGPFMVLPKRGRGQRPVKAYLCLFVCMTTKAVHLEVASDLSTASFMAALKRFICRRGPVQCFFSDNGTNYLGAKGELGELYEFLQSDAHKSAMDLACSIERIEWQFNPPSAPHMGGLWESCIKGVKTHLYRTIGAQNLTYEELSTVFVQIEAVLNSRPLSMLSDDPSELTALTPAHFLLGKPLAYIPAVDVTNINVSRLSRPQLMDSLLQNFWKRWKLEYLHTLQSRSKWNTEVCPVSVGQVVLVMEDSPPLHWPLGRIVEIYPSRVDNQVRVVLVRTAKGLYKRPVVKLCPLPTQ